MESEGGLVVRGRVEIDMRQPFRSVKEAISLFGEKVLAGEIYANKLKEMQTNDQEGTREGKKQSSRFGTVTADQLEETKQSLEKTKEEGNLMAYYLNSLKQELEQTKKELQQLKSRETEKPQVHDPEIEEIKFVENTTKVEVKTQTDENDNDDDDHFEFQKKRSVKFASPPLLTKVIVSKDNTVAGHDQEERDSDSSPSSEKKLKRKPLIPLIGALFLKKKGTQKSGSRKA